MPTKSSLLPVLSGNLDYLELLTFNMHVDHLGSFMEIQVME